MLLNKQKKIVSITLRHKSTISHENKLASRFANISRIRRSKEGALIEKNNTDTIEISNPSITNGKCESIDDNKSHNNVDTSKLFIAISELDDKYNIKLKSFPKVIVVGSQSSGKSSVIEGICGESILPKSMKMSTLKPIHLTTIRFPTKKFKIGDKEYFSDVEAIQEIERLNNNSHVSKVNVTIWSPDVYNATLVDLPGLFVVASKDMSDLPKKIRGTCRSIRSRN
jgi:hypothetical protein